MSEVFAGMRSRGHEQIVFCSDEASGLRGIIAIHNTSLGPALGGCRRWHYESESAALEDVMRLSEAMTYKAAAADLPMGGAKSVIWKHTPEDAPSEALARAMGQYVDRLKGLYIAAEDVGIDTRFIDWMAGETPHVMGGETTARGGDPAPYTARGVVNGIKAGLEHSGKAPALEGVTIAIQGLGALGANVARIAINEGANVLAAEINEKRLAAATTELPKIEVVALEEILRVECDVLCPCALGGVVTSENIGDLNCAVLCPGANNVLGDPSEDAKRLKDRGIIYCPDFVANGGGLIQLAGLWCGFDQPELDRRLANIQNAVGTILKDSENMASAHEAALAYARKRLEAGKPLNEFATA